MKSEEKFYEFEDLNSSTNTQFNNATGDKIDTYLQTLIGLTVFSIGYFPCNLA